jgi:hypothetical protein
MMNETLERHDCIPTQERGNEKKVVLLGTGQKIRFPTPDLLVPLINEGIARVGCIAARHTPIVVKIGMVHDAIAYAPYKCTLQMTIYQFEVPVFLRKTGTSKTYTAYELMDWDDTFFVTAVFFLVRCFLFFGIFFLIVSYGEHTGSHRRKFIDVTYCIVCQINILVEVQALAWFCQAKAWTPFSESL